MKQEKKYLSVNEQANLKAEIDEMKKTKAQLLGEAPPNKNQGIEYGPMKLDDGHPVDINKMEQIIRHKEKVLDEGRVPKIQKGKVKELESEIATLTGQLKGKFLTNKELGLKPSDRGEFRRAVQKAREGECNPAVVKAAERLKFLRSRLDPSNPELRSLDFLRE